MQNLIRLGLTCPLSLLLDSVLKSRKVENRLEKAFGWVGFTVIAFDSLVLSAVYRDTAKCGP
jgi:hypothetical protein